MDCFLRLDNFVTANGNKVCDMSKVSESCKEKKAEFRLNKFCVQMIVTVTLYVPAKN